MDRGLGRDVKRARSRYVNLSNCCGLGTSTTHNSHFYLKLKPVTTIHHNDERSVREERDGRDHEKDERYEKDEKERMVKRKINCTPRQTSLCVLRRGSARWRADRQCSSRPRPRWQIFTFVHSYEIQLSSC